MNDITPSFEILDRKERNEIEVQMAESDPIVNKDESWVDKLDWKERNEIEILLADQELDERMYPIWKDAIDEIRRRYWAFVEIYKDGVAKDEIDFVLWMIDDVLSDIQMWRNNDPDQWVFGDYNDDGDDIGISIDCDLANGKKQLEHRQK